MKEEYIENSRIREIDASVSETIDCREGVLLDSYIAINKEGAMFIAFETYETSRSSGYTIITSDSEEELWKRWDEITAGYDNSHL